MAELVNDTLIGSHVGRRRRSDDFPVRQWLKLGLASAGMGAALLGLSLVGPDPATASADTGGESSATSDSTDSGDAGSSVDAGDSETEDSASGEDEDAAPTDADDESADDVSVAEDAEAAEAEAEADELADQADVLSDDDVNYEASIAETDDVNYAVSTTETEALADDLDSDEEFLPATPSPYVSLPDTYDRWIEAFLNKWTDNHEEWVDSLEVSDESKQRLNESFLAMRRTLFNQAPTVAPVQITGLFSGAVTGSLGGEDADGDRLTYVLTKAPTAGQVVINADGTYTYTPNADFNGVDSFRVTALDEGSNLNLLQLLRPVGASATSLINQGAVKFDFRFVSGAIYWNADRQRALNEAANQLIQYFRVTKPVTLTYDVEGFNDSSNTYLAYAGSRLISTRPGFWPTVVQNKLISGRDANGRLADGFIRVNFGQNWSLGDVIAPRTYDFKSTTMHEMLHSLGWVGRVKQPGSNGRNRSWSTYDKLLVGNNGRRLISSSYRWNSAYDPLLLGRDGRVSFGGGNAVAAYDDYYVPLYIPHEWSPASSVYHLDTVTFRPPNAQLMNHSVLWGPAPRWLSPIELGVLTDLGYIMAVRHSPPTWGTAAAA